MPTVPFHIHLFNVPTEGNIVCNYCCQ